MGQVPRNFTTHAAIALLLANLAYGHDRHHRHHNDNASESNDTRRLGLFDGPVCQDGDPTYTVGHVTYQCLYEFEERGGNCRSPDRTADEKIVDDEDFEFWKDVKKGKRGKSRKLAREGRNLGGCGVDCVDWDTTIITVPTVFHVIHDGKDGEKYAYAENPRYIEDQIKVMNLAFRGTEGMFPKYYRNDSERSYPGYKEEDSDARIQFCLQKTTQTDNQRYYDDNREKEMKQELRVGGMETLNVYVNTAGGYLGYAYFPENKDSVYDGVTLLNDSLPGGSENGFNEGDTLTHEVGHWFNLDHTHFDGCKGPGDYMNEAPPGDYIREKTNEKKASFGCPIGEDTCDKDSGLPNPIHNFMSYVDDDCMDEFTPGQVVKMRAAWELYRHKENYSELFSLASDGVNCVFGSQETNEPSPNPSGVPSMAPSESFVPTAPFTDSPTLSKVPTSFPTGSPSFGPTLFPTGSPSGSPVVVPDCGVTGVECNDSKDCCSNQCKKDKTTKSKACK